MSRGVAMAGWVGCNIVPVLCAALLVAALAPWATDSSTGVAAHVTLLAGAAVLQGAWVARVGVSGWRWAAYTLAGVLAGGVLGIAMLITLDGAGYETLGSLLGVGAFGLGMSVAQWRVIRRSAGIRSTWAAWWVPASVAGWVAGAAVWGLVWRSVAVRNAVDGLLPFFAPDVLVGSNEVSLLATALACYAAATAVVAGRLFGVGHRAAASTPPAP